MQRGGCAMADETPLFTGSEASASPTEQDTSPSASTVNPDVMGRWAEVLLSGKACTWEEARVEWIRPGGPRMDRCSAALSRRSWVTCYTHIRTRTADVTRTRPPPPIPARLAVQRTLIPDPELDCTTLDAGRSAHGCGSSCLVSLNCWCLHAPLLVCAGACMPSRQGCYP